LAKKPFLAKKPSLADLRHVVADLRHELHNLGPDAQDILKKYLEGKLGLCLNASANDHMRSNMEA
jgi:hypothetical protein